MNVESLITAEIRPISILGVGNYGKNIINNLQIPNDSADLICNCDNGEISNAAALSELKFNELVIIIADASDAYTINTLPKIIDIAKITKTLSLCFLLAPSHAHPTIQTKMYNCINKIQHSGGKVALFSEHHLSNSSADKNMSTAHIKTAASLQIKTLVQQLVKLLMLESAVSVDISDLKEIFTLSSRFSMQFTESKDKEGLIKKARRAPFNERGEPIAAEQLSGAIVFIEADNDFTLNDYALLGDYLQKNVPKSAKCIIGIYPCEGENFYSATRINLI